MPHQFNNQHRNVSIDLAKCEPEQRKAYSRMQRGAGKGDLPRSIYSNSFRQGWDRVFGKRKTQA